MTPRKAPRRLAIAVAGILTGVLAARAVTVEALAPPLVFLRDVDATILQDMRYAGYDNFTGAPVAGYEAGECALHREAAEALARVQARLRARGLSLKVYDCYRPLRAVAAFMEWANRRERKAASRRFFPTLSKDVLVQRGYIAPLSGHSRAIAVDLTLVALPVKPAAAFDPAAAYGPCTGLAASRAPDNSVDMGTGYDCFDTRSHTADRRITRAQRQSRETLVEAMAREGFANFEQEWWHFAFRAAEDSPPLDVVVPVYSKKIN